MIYVRESRFEKSRPSAKRKIRYAIYRCPDCGKEFERIKKKETPSSCRSCAAYKNPGMKTHGKSNTRLHRIWKAMRTRCYNKNTPAYKNYGGRGIKVSKEWEDFEVFYKWAMNNQYADSLSIDRIDNNIGYSEFNCRWVSATVQNNNKSRLRSDNTSGFVGVRKEKRCGSWVAELRVNKKLKHIGSFDSAKDAAQARNEYIIRNNLINQLS